MEVNAECRKSRHAYGSRIKLKHWNEDAVVLDNSRFVVRVSRTGYFGAVRLGGVHGTT